MTALNIDYDGDIAFAINDLPGSFTWGGTAYAAIVDPINKQENVEGMEGYRSEVNFMIVVQTSLFTGSRPAVGDVVTIGGVEYRIDGTEPDESDQGLNLHVVGLIQ